jgi:hypothetical protein
MAQVFLSYSRANRERVRGINDGLGGGGYSVWWDERLNASDDYAMLIEEKIDAASCVVVAWSQAARQSLWVRAEANEGLDAGKLVQINLDGARLPLPFTMLHALDFKSWRGEARGTPWDDLTGRVGAMVRGEKQPIARREMPEAPALQGFFGVALLGWAALGLAVFMALMVGAAAAGQISPGTFSGLTLLGVAMAAVLLGLTAFTLIRVSAASRR